MAKQILLALILVICQRIDCGVLKSEEESGTPDLVPDSVQDPVVNKTDPSGRNYTDELLPDGRATTWLNKQLYGYGNHRYYIRTEAKTWDDAHSYCKVKHGYLAEMDSEAEWAHIFTQLQRTAPNDDHWLGCRGYGKYGGWFWKSKRGHGTLVPNRPAGSANWFSASPNTNGPACMFSDSTGTYSKTNNWEDSPCSSRKHFICEFE